MSVEINRNKDGTFMLRIDGWFGSFNTIAEVLREVERRERELGIGGTQWE